ncbi:PKD domain-containing protein [Marivirga salinae]|uniref:PKD domain-containing protein n=1 Tax=Marivirga salinarum TaxID=3059078 RepID=A0AA51NCN9_9BACT|nr:PKD domain-containing protein [Marivirga sp. BDSF4-3]WMN11141.1 PKD domain-containing protein [Marivirga sp. BDSF4-3]
MLKSNGYIKYFLVIGIVTFSILFFHNDSYAQCANISGQASGVSPGVGCSPHLVNFTTDYDVINLTAADIAYEVDWGDGNTDVYVLGSDAEITTSVVNASTTKISLAANHTFVSGTMCRYEITANLRFDGTSCTEQQLQPVVVWDNDNVNGGTVAMDPDEYEVCAGSEVTVNFTDITDFNCTPPDYMDSNPNFFARTYAFEYGTFNSIANIEVDGAVRTYPYYDGVVFTTPDGDLDNDGQLTYDIFVPGSANVTEQFEVTLYYWNFCNPFNGNPAAPNFGDAQTATALITIVPPPEPEPQVFDANEDFATESGNNSFWYDNTQPTQTFCADQIIHFRQDPSANPGTDYAWDFDWDGTIAGFDSTANGASTSFSYDALTYAGQTVEIGLKISRGDVGTPCIFYESIEIEIEEGPQASFTLDENDGCEEVTFNTTNTSNDATDYEWSITQISGPAGTIEDITAQENSVNLSNVTITGPGTYEVELLATSTLVTSCPNSTTRTITIYDNPAADFTADDVCFGDDLIFEDLSNITTVVNSDNIDNWEFVFDFNNTDYTTDPEGTFNAQTITTLASGDFTGNEYAHTYPAAGTYNVALRVITANGCVSAVDTASVVVKNNPISNFEFADNGIDYTQDLCPGTPIEIKNTSPAGQTDPAVDQYYLEIISEDGANDGFFPTFPAAFVLPGDSAIINPNPGDLPNPNSSAEYTYEFYIIAEGDNNCDTREGPISITLLPAQAAEFDIFENDPGPPPGTAADPYDNLEVYCSPYEFYFRTDGNTQTFNADEYIWTITDGVGDTLTETTINTATNPTPERFNFNFENIYPSVSQEVFTINLQVITDDYCVTDRNETVRLFPKPTGDFVVQNSVITCDSVSYTFKAVQENIDYFWSLTASDPTKIRTAVADDVNAEFRVSFDRPSSAEPDLDFTVELYTENLVLCQSETKDMDLTIPKAEIVNVDIDFTPTDDEACLPSIYDLQNTTASSPPTGTEWEFEIYKYNTATTVYDLVETLKGEDQPVGNKDFNTAIPYEFTERGSYRIDLVANLVSNCRIGLSTPVDIDIFETPEPNFRTNITKGCSPLDVTLIENSLITSGDPFDLSIEVYDPVNNIVTQTIAATSGTGGQLNNVLLDPLINTTTDSIDYEITLTATANNSLNCSLDSTVIVRVYQEPEIDFAVTSTNPACQKDYEFTFDISSINVPAGTDLIWNWGDGDPVFVTDETVTTVSHEYSNRASFFGNDTYTVTLTAETPNNCSFSITETINLYPRLQAQFNASTEQGCDPLNVTFTSASLGTNIAGGHEYYRRLQGDVIWNPIDSVSNTGTVSEYLENNTNNIETWEILYIVQGEGGCRDTANIKEITVNPSPDFQVNVINSPLCQTDENGDYEFEFELDNVDVPAGTEFTWNWGDGSTPLTTNSDANQTHIFNNRLSYFGTDNYTVTVSAESADGCIINEMVNIQLHPQIEAIFFQNLDEGCAPLTVNFTSSSRGTGLINNYVYQFREQGETTWNTISGTSPNGVGSFEFQNTTGSNLIYEVRHLVTSDLGNCEDISEIQEITVFPEFNSPTVTGPSEVCTFEQNVQYSVPDVPSSNFNWSLPQGAFIVNQNTNGSEIEVNFSSFSGVMEVTEENANGCFGNPNSIPVTVLPGPTVSLSLNGPNTICPGDTTSLQFDLSGPGNQGFDVIYSNGQQTDTLENIQNGHIETITPTQSSNYFVLNVIDRQYPACSASSVTGSAFVNVNFAPSASLSGSTTICEDGSTNLFINLTGAGPWDLTYTDGNSNFLIENITSPVYQLEVSPSINTTYELVSVTDSNNPVCSGAVSGIATVEINTKPTAEISGDYNNVCANEFVSLDVELTGYEPWTIRYTDGTNIFTVPNITANDNFDPENDTYNHSFDVFPPTGTTEYTLVDVRDSNSPNCLGDISGRATVNVFDRPTVEIEGNNTICSGESSPLTFNFTGDGPFNALVTANQDTLEYTNLQNGQSVTLSPENSTVYRVIELVDSRGCLGNSLGGPVSINVNQLPTSEISGDDVTCYGEETELIFDQSGVGPWTITYSDGSQNFSFTTSFNRHFEPVFPTTTTTYTLVSVVDSNSPESCIGSVSGSALKEVFPELEANFEATPQDMILPESTVSITNNTTNKNEWEYEWDFGDGTISTETDPAPHEYGTFGTFVIRMTATNGQCTDTYQTTITIGAIPPIVDFDATPKEGCLPLVVEFENLTQFADPSTYQWEFGDGQRVAAVENPTHVYRNPGTYSVRLSATNITGQRTEMFKEEFIVVNATPTASFTIPDEYRQVFTGEEVRFVNLSEGADEFIWKFGDGNESFEEEPIHAYPDSGIYDITLIAINSETGCTDSMTLSSQVQVILGGASDVPNAFTPSRAGPGTASSNPLQNDFFLPKVEGVSQFNMKIYNRWGELLFESNDRTVGWDGYYNGVLMPQGVYVYRLELVFENGRRETKVGDITLIR